MLLNRGEFAYSLHSQPCRGRLFDDFSLRLIRVIYSNFRNYVKYGCEICVVGG
jgi:hypothetical protein